MMTGRATELPTTLPAHTMVRPGALNSPATIRFPLLASDIGHWPHDVQVVMSSLDAAARSAAERRLQQRRLFRVKAQLQLFGEPIADPPIVLYSRNLTDRGMGFITRTRLPVSRGGAVQFLAADGEPVRTSVTVTRCRQIAPEWYEGSVQFIRGLQLRPHSLPAVC